MQLRSFFDKVLANYDKGNVHDFKRDLTKENYAEYTLNSLFELDKFWAEILYYLLYNLKEDESKISVDYGFYTWWMLINLGSETKLYAEFKKRNVINYFILLRDLPLNRWALKIYKDLGHKGLIKEIPEIDENTAMNTVGDSIIQVIYPKEVVKKIRGFFEKYSSVQEMSMKEITEIAHAPCKIKFIVFKNKIMARNFNETYLKYFK